MAIFGFGKDKKEGGAAPEMVLAYLEDAQRVRAPFTLAGPRKTEVPAVLQNIDETEGTATFQLTGPLLADKGAAINLIFIQEGLRVAGSSRLVETRPGVAVLELPEALELKERRGAARARVNAKEGATFTALTGIFDGVGITGILENIGESGARVRVEKAMSIKGEKRLPLGAGLVPPGQAFMLVKLNKIPKCPPIMELEGASVYLDSNAAGLSMGVKFTRPKGEVTSALRGMVGSRASAMPSVLPLKSRRKAVEPQTSSLLDDEPLFQAPRPAAKEPVEVKAVEIKAVKAPEVPSEPVKPPEPPPVEPRAEKPTMEAKAEPRAEKPTVEAKAEPRAEPVLKPPPPEEEGQAATKSDSLMRLKKRSRAVVALSRTAAFGDCLKAFLQEDGFGRVFTTTYPDEVVELLRQPNQGVLVLDGNMSIIESLEFVQNLRAAIHDLPPIILAAEDISTAVVLAARRKGVSQLVVRPYALDGTFSTLLMEQIALK